MKEGWDRKKEDCRFAVDRIVPSIIEENRRETDREFQVAIESDRKRKVFKEQLPICGYRDWQM